MSKSRIFAFFLIKKHLSGKRRCGTKKALNRLAFEMDG